jgi:hypothetical protein
VEAQAAPQTEEALMPFYLPVPPPPLVEDAPKEAYYHGLQTATGGPTPGEDSAVAHGVGVVETPRVPYTDVITRYRTGPGDTSPDIDQWMGEDIFIVPRDGVMNGKQLFDENVWQPPNEGHGEYGFAQDGPFIDHSTRNLALFWSDWNASTSLISGGRGAFTGEHVVIRRAVPGSTQGYMPTYTEQYNTARDMPGPWDEQLLLSREQYISDMRAATSMPPAMVNG